MPVSPFSRYAGLPTLQVADASGRTATVLALRRPMPPEGLGAARHQVVGSEPVDAIARHYYGREDLWWQVMDGNPLRFPLDVKAGDVLELQPPRAAGQVSREQRFR